MIPTVIEAGDFGDFADWSDGVVECCFFSITPLLHYSTLHCLIASSLDRFLRLLQQSDVVDSHLLIDGLAHVVNCQERDAHPGERLHFHTRLGHRPRGALDLHALRKRHDVDIDLAQRQGVTKRNEVGRLFRGLDAGDSAINSIVAGSSWILPEATAVRATGGLAETSTIWARPSAPMCESRFIFSRRSPPSCARADSFRENRAAPAFDRLRR